MHLFLKTGLPRSRARVVAALAVVMAVPLIIAAALVTAPDSSPAPAEGSVPRILPARPAETPIAPPPVDERPVPAAAPSTVATPPPPPVPFLDTHRVVSYYGNPLAASMGILGEYPPAEVIRRLRAQAAVYQPLSPDREVVPAVHLIFAVAQAAPGTDGLYLFRMADELVKQWIAITRDNGLLLFLDIQLGRSTIDRELPLVLPYLAESHVHLALDPEFAWDADARPVADIGHLTGEAINHAQELLQRYVVEQALPGKILIVHQFRQSMIRKKDQIRPYEQVELVIDMDGFGPPAAKLDSWNSVIVGDGVQRAGIKLFYQHDAESGGLMSEADVMALEPAPVVIIYQ